MGSRMKDSVHFNIEFISEIEKHPQLYDNRLLEYGNRSVLEDTWTKVAQKFNETPYDCKTKWKSIRSAYIRSLGTKYRSGSVGSKKEYYLASNLKFLNSFVRSGSQKYNTIKNSSQIADENQINHESEEDSFSDESQLRQVSKYIIPVEVKNEDQSNDEIHSPSFTDSSVSHSPLTAHSKRKKIDDTVQFDLNKEQCESFLLSLVPHMASMNQQQQLSFQRGVLELIENIKYPEP